MPKKAVTYVRVSSKEQEQHGYSPQAQKRLLWSFARENGFHIVEDFQEAETAKKKGRPAFNAMLDYVRENGIEYILVEKTDRLYRNWSDFVKIDELANEYGVTVYLVKENESIGKDASASQKFIHTIKTAQARYFLDNLSEETKKGADEKLRLGEPPGCVPLGYKNAKDPITGRSIVAVDDRYRLLIQEMFRLYATGLYSLHSLIDKLERMGLAQSLPEGRKLNKTMVAKYLQNPFYIGHYRWRGQVHTNGNYEKLISIDVWHKAQTVLKKKNKNKQCKHNTIPFLFKGCFTCAECGRNVTAEQKIKKSGKEYVYYRCTKYQRKCSQKPVNEAKIQKHMIDTLAGLEMSEKGLEYVKAALKLSLNDKKETHDKIYQGLLRERSTLKNRLERVYEDHLDDNVPKEQYEKLSDKYARRLDEIDVEMRKHDKADVNYYDFGVRILELAKNAQLLYEMAEPEEKQELLHYLLSNSQLKDRTPIFGLKKPFNKVSERAKTDNRKSWQPVGELNPCFQDENLVS